MYRARAPENPKVSAACLNSDRASARPAHTGPCAGAHPPSPAGRCAFGIMRWRSTPSDIGEAAQGPAQSTGIQGGGSGNRVTPVFADAHAAAQPQQRLAVAVRLPVHLDSVDVDVHEAFMTPSQRTDQPLRFRVSSDH